MLIFLKFATLYNMYYIIKEDKPCKQKMKIKFFKKKKNPDPTPPLITERSIKSGFKGYNERQIGLLKSDLEHMQNNSYYPSFYEKLTHLIFACVKFHPFLDGNKRTAIYSAVYFIRLNKKKKLKNLLLKWNK